MDHCRTRDNTRHWHNHARGAGQKHIVTDAGPMATLGLSELRLIGHGAGRRRQVQSKPILPRGRHRAARQREAEGGGQDSNLPPFAQKPFSPVGLTCLITTVRLMGCSLLTSAFIADSCMAIWLAAI